MNITQIQRLSHVVENEPESADAGQFSAGTAAVWRITARNEDGSFMARKVYDDESHESIEITVTPLPGDALLLGDCGIIVTTGNGEWRFFRRRAAFTEHPSHKALWLSGSGTEDCVAKRTRTSTYEDDNMIRVWKFNSPIALDETHLLAVKRLALEVRVESCAGAGTPTYTEVSASLAAYLIFDDFDLAALDAAAYGALPKECESTFYPCLWTSFSLPIRNGSLSAACVGGPWVKTLMALETPRTAPAIQRTYYGLSIEVSSIVLSAAEPWTASLRETSGAYTLRTLTSGAPFITD